MQVGGDQSFCLKVVHEIRLSIMAEALRQHFNSCISDKHSMFELSGEQSVTGYGGPFVRPELVTVSTY